MKASPTPPRSTPSYGRRGWVGSVKTVQRYVAPFRQALAAPDPARQCRKTCQITRWLLTRPEHLQPDEQAQLDAIRSRSPHLDALAGHVTASAEMMTARTGSRDLEGWLAAVEADDKPGLRPFAAGIRHDLQAVINGLTLPYSSGKVEGTVNKIKLLKRQMYGRAGFALLRNASSCTRVTRTQNSWKSPILVTLNTAHVRPFRLNWSATSA
jgi:transposase